MANVIFTIFFIVKVSLITGKRILKNKLKLLLTVDINNCTIL